MISLNICAVLFIKNKKITCAGFIPRTHHFLLFFFCCLAQALDPVVALLKECLKDFFFFIRHGNSITIVFIPTHDCDERLLTQPIDESNLGHPVNDFPELFYVGCPQVAHTMGVPAYLEPVCAERHQVTNFAVVDRFDLNTGDLTVQLVQYRNSVSHCQFLLRIVYKGLFFT